MKHNHTHDWIYIGIWSDGSNEFRAYKCECGAVLTQFFDGGEVVQEPPKKEDEQ